MDTQRLKQVIDFMRVTDQMKLIYRTVEISNNERGESDAEHSWHLVLFSMLLEKDLPQNIDTLKLYKMLLIHDMVEIYAGDTPLYDDIGRMDKVEREAKIAKAFDKIHPLIQNLCSNGTDYKKFHATYDNEKQRIKKYVNFDPTLEQISNFVLDEAKKCGYIK